MICVTCNKVPALDGGYFCGGCLQELEQVRAKLAAGPTGADALAYLVASRPRQGVLGFAEWFGHDLAQAEQLRT